MNDAEQAQLQLLAQLLTHHNDAAHVWTKMLYEETDSPALADLAKSLWPVVGPQACDAEWLQSTMVAWRNTPDAPMLSALGTMMTGRPRPGEPPKTAVGALDPRPHFRRTSGVWGPKNPCVVTRIESFQAVVYARLESGTRPHSIMFGRHAYDPVGLRATLKVGDPVCIHLTDDYYPLVVAPREDV